MFISGVLFGTTNMLGTIPGFVVPSLVGALTDGKVGIWIMIPQANNGRAPCFPRLRLLLTSCYIAYSWRPTQNGLKWPQTAL